MHPRAQWESKLHQKHSPGHLGRKSVLVCTVSFNRRFMTFP